MKHGDFFRLTRTAMAIAQRDSRNVAIMIPEGAVIELLDGPFDGVRLMDVRYNGEVIMMFTNDMEHHTEIVRAETAECPPMATSESLTIQAFPQKILQRNWKPVNLMEGLATRSRIFPTINCLKLPTLA